MKRKLIDLWHKHILPAPSPYGFSPRIRYGHIPTWWKLLPECVTHFWVWVLPSIIYRPFWKTRAKETFTDDDLAHLTPEERKALK